MDAYMPTLLANSFAKILNLNEIKAKKSRENYFSAFFSVFVICLFLWNFCKQLFHEIPERCDTTDLATLIGRMGAK